ncbi:hypothetical protein [Phyllobacterium sp. YR531]|uniref:hypothetical protein n=1 Tax=Phyllobacterium sp. YR531 TaxID=1144343 RepID=UPI00026F49A9|nr:hypothetical protein [Phyllobacterium sp. YR531]EJN03105.1 hypothetical protein PMI41_02652 [Phyllobacterium sp. YR531]
MLDNDHQPVKLTGLLVLAAIAVIFLIIVWLIGSAFVQPEDAPALQSWNKFDVIRVVVR